LSDKEGFRTDVIELLKPLNMPLVRYPGGNFVSSYNWKDGVGPRESRKPRPDYAWKSIEPNTFGTDEFMRWAKKVGTKPMLAVNLGTAGTSEAMELLEYCNLPAGTAYADMRVHHGHKAPYKVEYWCLGNEMDGPWQAGHVPAEEYARRAQSAGKVMKGLDPSIKLIICGSSGRFMNTYMQWDRQILEYCWDDADYISAHRYSGNHSGNSDHYLAEGVEIDQIIHDYRSVIGFVRGQKRSKKNVYLSFDEWNVWYKAMAGDGGWKVAPHLLEEVYNFEDALVCAQYLMSFIRNADVVKLACIAQLVNVIGPLLTRPDGTLVQSIYYPFLWMSQHVKGVSLQTKIHGPSYKAGERGDVPAMDAAVSYDETNGQVCAVLLNRDRTGPRKVTMKLEDRTFTTLGTAHLLHHNDLKAANSWEHRHVVGPGTVETKVVDGALTLELPGPSLAVVTVGTGKR
jgi:alpha-N-arabinofuranosidase